MAGVFLSYQVSTLRCVKDTLCTLLLYSTTFLHGPAFLMALFLFEAALLEQVSIFKIRRPPPLNVVGSTTSCPHHTVSLRCK